MILRTATRADLPAVLALLADEERVVDPASVAVDDAYERAFAAIERATRATRCWCWWTVTPCWAAPRRRTYRGSAGTARSGC
ncbi:hypothetical protein [Streptomyces sp. NPDC058240]|uniref:hypothetical protein n=1 Tax=Streptomyces sp. NPDC058240 TaxID=3346396 RepID=UPI0036E2BEE8